MSLFSPMHRSSAKVVDQSLVLSLPDAISPVVMRLSLEDVKSATLGVEEKDGRHVLIVRFNEKDVRDIATYEERDDAIAALMAASSALEKGSRSSGDHTSSGGHGSSFYLKGGVLKWVGAIAALLVLLYIIAAVSSNRPGLVEVRDAGSPTTATESVNPAQTGVPMSADSFLSNR